MNTKLSSILIITLMALLAACSPADDGIAKPVDPVQPAAEESVALVPITGDAAVESAGIDLEPSLWSGEVSLSDNDNPDPAANVETGAQQVLPTGCMSVDEQPRRHGGCVE